MSGLQALVEHTLPSPFRLDGQGVVRIGRSRIPIDLVIAQYHAGMTPEALIQAYDSLSLADVYSAIAAYLLHRDEFDRYLANRQSEADTIQASIESKQAVAPSQDSSAQRNPRMTPHVPVAR